MRILPPAVGLLSALLLSASGFAQVQPPPAGGAAALELMLRRLGNTATVMITNAHPDDENNALIAMLAHGLGVRCVEATATRGEGGQNDLGPEHGMALSVLRTEELLAAHRIDGAEQVFARAVDFGYSFSVEETFEKWGNDEILGDYVRLIRMIRPEVIITMSPDGGGGGQHHQASARITREAFDAAADPTRFPEQIAAGLPPWKAARLYVPLAAPPPADEGPATSRSATRRAESAPATRPGDVVVDLDVFDPALGATYNEIGTLARSMHKSQGMARLLALPGPAVARFRLAAGVPPNVPELRPRSEIDRLRLAFGIDIGLERLGWPLSASAELHLAIEDAGRALRSGGPSAAVAPLVSGIRILRNLRGSVSAMNWASFEIERRLAQKEKEFLRAFAIASGLRLEALANDGTVVPGQEVTVSVYVANRMAPDLVFERVTFEGFDAAEGGCATRPAGPIRSGGLVTCESKLRIPKDARSTSAHWNRIAGTARNEFEPDVPFGAPFRPTPFRARIHMTQGGVPLVFEVPVEHRDGSDPLAGEKRSEVLVVPPEKKGQSVLRIEYQHTRRRHLVPAPERLLPAADAKVALPLRVGYVASQCDQMDEFIRHLGPDVETLDAESLRSKDLAPYPVIVVGSRALELGASIRQGGRRLVQYVEGGGTLIVLYQRSGLDEGSCAPCAAKTSGNRVTDENAPVKLLVPDHPLFMTPNKLTPEDWVGWVQERGRSFLETKDARYVDLIEMEDPFEFNKGPKRGALVEARVGKGRWIYVGLSLSRQLEAGVPGAYRLLANLLSLRGD